LRFLALTLVLVGASCGLATWVYLRDRDTSETRLPERQLVRVDAVKALTVLGEAHCRKGCTTEILAHSEPHSWTVKVGFEGRVRCLRIDPRSFAANVQHGLSGVRPDRCTARQRSVYARWRLDAQDHGGRHDSWRAMCERARSGPHAARARARARAVRRIHATPAAPAC
jgi:hypothetical protein